MVGSISDVSNPTRREEDVALELSLDMENEEAHHSDGRKGDLEGIGAMFDGWMNIAGHRKGERIVYEEIVDCLAGIAR
jgi:hypothetical protein